MKFQFNSKDEGIRLENVRICGIINHNESEPLVRRFRADTNLNGLQFHKIKYICDPPFKKSKIKEKEGRKNAIYSSAAGAAKKQSQGFVCVCVQKLQKLLEHFKNTVI